MVALPLNHANRWLTILNSNHLPSVGIKKKIHFHWFVDAHNPFLPPCTIPYQDTAMATEITEMKDYCKIWKELAAWIEAEGGEVHPHLTLQLLDGASSDRGVFATADIAVGATLLRLPAKLAVDGRDMPNESYSIDKTTKKASPWLRCLAAYYRASRDAFWTPYRQSLPASYETVQAWSDTEIQSYLAGTSTLGGSDVTWRQDERPRYQAQVRPYLLATGVLSANDEHDGTSSAASDMNEESELVQFSLATACMSTRGFHLSMNDNQTKTTGHAQSESYPGPFLLPAIDLLNHAATGESGHVTTLQFEQGSFVMKAESAIAAHSEIKHSYGDMLTACQFLSTFGFVPHSRMIQTPPHGTPALIRKQDILEACWKIIESDLPQRLAQTIEELDMEDEVWALQVDRSRTADFIADDLIVDGALSDEIVTTACVAFLPLCAYREASQALISVDILDDFFLGNLACTALLQVLQTKLQTYTSILWKGQTYSDDTVLLQQLMDGKTLTATQRRLSYGLTLRLEEKACLQALRRNIMNVLSKLEEDLPATAPLAKKQRMQE